MLNSRKTMIIGLVIGFGSGLFISGIIISVLFYTSTKVDLVKLPPSLTNGIHDLPNTTNNEVIYKETKEEVVNNEEDVPSNEINDEIINKEATVQELSINTENQDKQFIEVTIPPHFGANQISKLLMEKGVVEDSDALTQYIISKNKTRNLLHGNKIFSYNSDLESILNILTSKN